MGGGGGDSGEESGAPAAPVVTVHIRCSNGNKFSVRTELDATVRAFKAAVATSCDVPAEQQRLIYKGRILKDEQTLSSYGIVYIYIYIILYFFSLFNLLNCFRIRLGCREEFRWICLCWFLFGLAKLNRFGADLFLICSLRCISLLIIFGKSFFFLSAIQCLCDVMIQVITY